GAGVSRERLARFIAEAQITAQLEHPSVVPVHEIGRMPGGMPYFTMKRIRGESLEDIINHLRVGDEWYRQRYTGNPAIRIFDRLCQGVAYAHDRGVVHRDLKPANILIGAYGEVQIMDWGLAKILSDSPLRKDIGPVRTVRDAPDLASIEGAIAGTPAYMSPEQARGDNDAVGKTSDVYSLGLMLAEFITLVRVFRNPGHKATLAQVRAAGPVNLADLNPNMRVEPELAAIVRQCTQPDPRLRYPDAGHLAEDLRCYLEDRQIPIAPDLSARRVVKWSRRHPVLSGALGATAIIFALEILLYLGWRMLG
ncbi:MAG: serine/threonine protein kinase, partial [Planctomycetota bacterium]|nr:serine/threonine protein kinase [Planctomycetota bacterium]